MVCGFVLLFFPSMVWSVSPGDPPPSSGWTITDPVADPVQEYDGNIGATGDAPSSGLGYVAKVLSAPTTVRASEAGTTTYYLGAGRWATTVQEPNDSWDGDNGADQYMDMTFAIYHDGVEKASVAIRCR